MRLKDDIASHCNPKILYGKANDEVTVISETGGIAIVETNDKQRFSCSIEKLTEEEVKVKEEIKVEEKIIIKPVQVAARPPKAKPALIKQQSLFYE